MRSASRLLWIVSALFVAMACAAGGKTAVSAGSEEPPEEDETWVPEADAGARAPADAGSDASGDASGDAAAPAEKIPPPVDPALVKLAIEKTSERGPASTFGVRFEVVELGPRNYWGFTVVNRGSHHVRVAFDSRVLSLELEPPQDPKKKWLKPKKTTCRMPENLMPGEADPAFAVELAPGEGIVETFDPRFYCVPSTGAALTPGIKVTARLGWTPKKPKVVWRKGKKLEEPVPQVEPFVVEMIDPGSDGGVPVEGVKELVATPFELNTQYSPPGSQPEIDEPPPPLEFKISRGSDARDEMSATVTTTIKNRSGKPMKVFFRRELLAFEVMGPGGLTTCDPQPDSRSPDKQAFRTLAPGGELSATSRLIELCPDGTFERPGMYLIHGRFVANRDGSEFGFEAFTGSLYSEEPAVVRIRKGELPFAPSGAQQRFSVGDG